MPKLTHSAAISSLKQAALAATSVAPAAVLLDTVVDRKLDCVSVCVCQGATIRRDEETGEIYIARVIHGGLADRSGETLPGRAPSHITRTVHLL